LLLGAFPTAEAAGAFADRVSATPAAEVLRLWPRAREAFLSDVDGAGAPPEAEADPETLEALEEALDAPLFRASVEGHSWRVASVALESLVTSQPLVQLARVDALARRIGEEGLLPILFPPRSAVAARVEAPGGASLALVTERADLVVSKIEARQAQATEPIEVVFRLEPRPNYLTVLRLGSRLVVRNGNHRLVGAWSRGLRRVPCVLVDEDEESVAERPDRFPPDALLGHRVPRIVDLVEPSAATTDVELAPRRHVTVFRAEQHWSREDG
jgi:hypothetical protein